MTRRGRVFAIIATILFILIIIGVVAFIQNNRYKTVDDEVRQSAGETKQEPKGTPLTDKILKVTVKNQPTNIDQPTIKNILQNIANLIYDTTGRDTITAVIQPASVNITSSGNSMVVYVEEDQVYYLATYYSEYDSTYLECASGYENSRCNPGVVGYNFSDEYRDVELQF